MLLMINNIICNHLVIKNGSNINFKGAVLPDSFLQGRARVK